VILVDCLLIKSTVLNHTSAAQETATSCPDYDDEWVRWKRHWRYQSKRHRNWSDILLFIVMLQKYLAVKTTCVQYKTTLLSSASKYLRIRGQLVRLHTRCGKK